VAELADAPGLGPANTGARLSRRATRSAAEQPFRDLEFQRVPTDRGVWRAVGLQLVCKAASRQGRAARSADFARSRCERSKVGVRAGAAGGLYDRFLCVGLRPNRIPHLNHAMTMSTNTETQLPAAVPVTAEAVTAERLAAVRLLLSNTERTVAAHDIVLATVFEDLESGP